MKKIVFLSIVLLMPVYGLFAQKSCQVRVEFSFANVEEGYDHMNKMVAFLDGEQIAESSALYETMQNSFSFQVPKGIHTLRLMNFAFYNDAFEEHTSENGYSYDCMYEISRNFNKKINIEILFDLDSSGPEVKVN